MKVRPQPPIVAASLSGFVVGVLLTLAGTGALSRAGPTSTPVAATLPPTRAVADAQLYAAVRRIVVRQLGQAYPDVKHPRLLRLRLDPVPPEVSDVGAGNSAARLRSLFVEFRLYDHPLGRLWRLRSAKADVFTLLKAVYTSGLPIYDVELVGIFPLATGNRIKDTRALVAFIDHPTADRIPWKRWGRDYEARLWNMLDYRHVDPRFA